MSATSATSATGVPLLTVTRYPALEPWAARYNEARAAGRMVPLSVTAELVPGGRVVSYDPINLDNLLARRVLEEATGGDGLLPDTRNVYALPVPLAVLWTSSAVPSYVDTVRRSGPGPHVDAWERGHAPLGGGPAGLPLYACTTLAPAPGEPSAPDVAYIHKRQQSGEFTATKSGVLGISATNGRWMERRVPFPTTVCDRLQARVVGDPDEIARLLRAVSFIGKRRAIGYGEVRRWRIEAASGDSVFSPVTDGPDGQGPVTTRTLPALAVADGLLGAAIPEGLPAPIGWTPPQWKPALQWPGWPVGTPVGTPVWTPAGTPVWTPVWTPVGTPVGTPDAPRLGSAVRSEEAV